VPWLCTSNFQVYQKRHSTEPARTCPEKNFWGLAEI
jgi:hypothetical protein